MMIHQISRTINNNETNFRCEKNNIKNKQKNLNIYTDGYGIAAI